jgi:uridine kinase
MTCPTTSRETLSDARRALLNGIAQHANRRKATTMVAVTGADCSGKSTFAAQLAEYCSKERPCSVVHVDDFHRPRNYRYAGADEIENYLRRSIDFSMLEERILEPLKKHGSVSFGGMMLDIPSDTYSKSVEIKVPQGALVIVEGVFLLRREFLKYWDTSLYLWVHPRVMLQRGLKRDGDLLGKDVERRYREKYLPAQVRHVLEERPLFSADFVINNNILDAPYIMADSERVKCAEQYPYESRSSHF